MPFAVVLAKATVDDVARVLDVATAVGQRLTTAVQLIHPDAVYNERHLEAAVHHAERAFARGTNSARTLGPEILLFLTGQRRIQDALELAGIRPGLERVVVLAVGDQAAQAVWGILGKLEWSKDPVGLKPNARVLTRFGLRAESDSPELELLERAALVELRK